MQDGNRATRREKWWSPGRAKSWRNWGAAAVLVCIACGAGPLAFAEGPGMASGVKVGEVSPRSAIVWMRLTRHTERNANGIAWPAIKKVRAEKKAEKKKDDSGSRRRATEVVEQVPLDAREGAVPGAAGEVRVVYWAKSKDLEKKPTPWLAVDPSRDFTRQFLLEGLEPATEYRYRVEGRRTGAGQASASTEGAFRTAPVADKPARVTFTVVTGQAYGDRDDTRGYQSYDAMLRLKPDFFVHTGDIVYYDGDAPIAQNVEQARHHWHRLYSLPATVEFHRHVASYFIKDDHDTWQNDCWPTMKNPLMGEFTFVQGEKVFLEQVPMGAEPGER